MKQRVLISVLPKEEGLSLLSAAPQLLESRSVDNHIRALIERNRVVFYSEHVDLWSMGDSFERFLRPKKQMSSLAAHSSELYVIPRESLRFHLPARNDEEQLFRDLLGHAKRIYRRTSPGAYLFVLRTVFDASDECDFSGS